MFFEDFKPCLLCKISINFLWPLGGLFCDDSDEGESVLLPVKEFLSYKLFSFTFICIFKRFYF